MKLTLKKKHLPLRVYLLLAGGAILAISYIYYGIQHRSLLPSGDTSQASIVHKEEVEVVPEAPVQQQFETPTRIIIDKIGVDAAIEPVGLTEDGLMDAPKTNEAVGWYEQSARLGENNYAILLDGHYGTETSPAVFRDLINLEIGDTILVGAAENIATFRVVEIDQSDVEDVDMKKALYPYRSGVQSLTIITCEGEYDPVNITYDKRRIVYAERVE